MEHNQNLLTDSFGRKHTYLRISLIERCNLRCAYCMPVEGIPLSPRSHIMTYEEIYTIAKAFVDHGVTKIRLTGGEPLIRKDVRVILNQLASLPVTLSITTNAVIVDQFIPAFKSCGIQSVNVSLDSLDSQRFKQITHRNYFKKTYENILLLVASGFHVKINVVLMKGFNDDEIIDFIQLTKELPVVIRFIEFMPFDGNQWNIEKMVSLKEIIACAQLFFTPETILRLKDAPNDTSKNYKIEGYKGTFAIISSITNPFCDSCNRLRLTANGKLKNCLFSAKEADLLSTLRAGESILPIIKKSVQAKLKMRGGMNSLEKIKNPELHSKNRSMTSIGG